jgi:hypothetical protein
MRTLTGIGLLAAASLTLSGCGRPAETATSQPEATPVAKAGKKCPDPNIRDMKDPCSPYYYPGVKGSFKGDKGL